MLVNLRLHRLQSEDWPDLDEWILRQYRVMYDAYFEDLPLVPVDRLVEVAYEDFERRPDQPQIPVPPVSKVTVG
jgi:hypothetical protein